MIINVVLMIFACMAGCLTINYARERKINTVFSRSILLMGVFATTICLSYSIMGLSLNFSIAKIARIVGILTIDCFLISEVLMMSSQLKINPSLLGIIDFIYISVSILDMLFFGNPSVARFTWYEGRTCYYANIVWQRTFHTVFILHIGGGLVIVWYLLWKKATFQRQKKALGIIFWGNILLLLSTLPDTFLPLMGYPSWPSSPIGVIVAFVANLYALYKYVPFEITENDLFSYIYQSTAIGCMTLNLDFTLAEINHYGMSLLAIKDKGQHLSDIFMLTETEEAQISELVMQNDQIERKLVARNTNRNVLLTLHVERDDKHFPYCIVGTMRDLANEDIMLNELHELNESKASFLMHMSHEIRTPVNTLLGMNEMIMKKTCEPRIRGYAENIKSSCNLLISIINDILDFSKIESGEITLSENSFSLQKLVNELISMVEDRTNKKGLSMVIDIDENLPDGLFGDEMRIRQIVMNLLTNAVKYTDYGTVKLKLTNESREGNLLKLRIDVIDTGKGISAEDKEKLFEAFRRVDEKRNRHIEGTGLGLSITSHFVSMMGGTIGVESEYGKGSDFYVIIPQKVVSDGKIGKFNGRSREMKHSTKKKKMVLAPDARVLVVDDNDMNLTVARLLLEETKMTVDLALDGKTALEKMRKSRYQIILLDHMMPQMDGIQVLKAIKQERLQEGVPVIVLTANAISGARQMYLSAGFDDYISKPVESERLNEILVKWLPEAYIEAENGGSR